MNIGLFFLVVLLCLCMQEEWIAGAGASDIEVNYGANPGSESAEDVVQLLRSRGIGLIRLHDADSAMLRALGSRTGGESTIEVIVGLRNDEIVDVGASIASARSWVFRNVMEYYPVTNIIAIAVGSEVLSSGNAGHENLFPFLLPAMKNVHSALVELGLEKQIKVSAPQSAWVLSSYFPPSSAAFDAHLTGSRVMAPLLEFLETSGSYFMLNLHPLDTRQLEMAGGKELPPARVSSAGASMDDPVTGKRYFNMLDVLIDAVSVAMASVDHPGLNIIVTETDWSRTGTVFSTGSSLSSSRASNVILIDRVSKGPGTFKPGVGRKRDVSVKPKKRSSTSRTGVFSSRRFLMDSLESMPAETGKRRRLAPNKSWCVAKSDGSTEGLQTALDWACGPGGADCSLLQVGQNCFLPNTIVAHASYAFNSYYQKQNWASDSCDFGGLATVTSSDPSTISCLYPSNTDANGSPSTPTGTTVPNSAGSRLLLDLRCFSLLTSFILGFVFKRTFADFFGSAYASGLRL